MAAADGLDLSRIFVTGFGGGALRGYYQFASPEESKDAAILLGKCELPVIDRFQHAMENWRAALDGYPSGIVADLLYHEIRGGCWAMPHQYGIANFVGTITPFSSRNLLISCILLPRNSRRALMKRAINDRRPELGSLPLNDFVGIRRFMRRVVHNRFWKLDRST